MEEATLVPRLFYTSAKSPLEGIWPGPVLTVGQLPKQNVLSGRPGSGPGPMSPVVRLDALLDTDGADSLQQICVTAATVELMAVTYPGPRAHPQRSLAG